MSDLGLPSGFFDLQPFVVDWALPTRAQRSEEAIAYLNGLDIDDLPDDATTLLHLLYSMILVSYAVNVFKQNRIPDSGAAFFEMVAEPAV
jgi:hypothetical protein